MSVEFEQVTAQQLHDYWPFIRVGLEAAKANSPADWDAEEHYAYIYSARAECFVVKRHNRLIGFFDGYPMPIDAALPGLKYFLWVCFSVDPRDRREEDRPFVAHDRRESLAFIMRRALQLNCKFIETNSTRLLHRYGFKEHHRTYRLFY